MIVLLRNADFSILKKPRHLKELTYRDAGHSNQIQLGQAVGDPKEIVEDMKTLGGHLCTNEINQSINSLNAYFFTKTKECFGSGSLLNPYKFITWPFVSGSVFGMRIRT